MMRAHCLMHVPFEGPGYIEDWFEARGTGLRIWKLYENNAFPETEELDFLLIMGGPMNIYEYRKYPYLKQEKEFIASCIGQQKKVLGICLGAQLIADAMGQKVYPNPEKEIGWFPVTGSWHLIQGFITPFHWHGETFDLPDGAEHLASSMACRNQGFSHGDNVLALQFHLELTPSLVEGLLLHAENDLSNEPWVQSRQEIRNGLVNTGANRELLYALLEEFIVNK